MRSFATLALALLIPSGAMAQAEAAEESTGFLSGLHVDLDLAMAETRVKFVGAETVVPGLCDSLTGCDNYDFSAVMMRGTLGVGFTGLVLEGSVDYPVSGEVLSNRYFVWSVGVRVDTSDDSWLSLHFRFHYVNRWGELTGTGGRAGIGLVIRPFRWIAAYGEASADVTTVPGEMNDAGTLFSYSTFLGGGVRLYLGR
ncbi:MAG: hypothetical protein AAGF12_23380 [Myxococcota bacterium]